MPSVTTTASTSDDGDFFDDDNNKAMYLVLPLMILIYGSCCLVYCIHKCRRYCVHKSKKKRKAEKKVLMKKEGNSFDNGGLSIVDENPPGSSSNPPPVILTLENVEGEQQSLVNNRRASRVCQETDVDSLVDVLQSESVSAVSPGYAGASLRQEMQHLDNQLKAAFRLSNQDGVKSNATRTQNQQQQQQSPQPPLKNRNGVQKPTHRSDVIQAYLEWKALQKTQPPKLEVKFTPSGDTVVVRIPKEKRLKMIQQQEAQPAATPTVHPMEADVTSIMDVRQKLNKDMPKSMPDIMRKPDENVTALKKLNSDTKRRIFLSCQ